MTLDGPPVAAPGQVIFNRYRVLEELGQGGMGRVLRVLDTKINEEIALKLIHPEVASRPGVRERFRNELKLARKVGHPNVCRLFDFDEHDGTPFITMELLAGEDLRAILTRTGALPVARALAITREICAGLREAHRLGVVHRDLKPRNIQIDPDGHPHIMDFGLARSVEVVGVTVPGQMVGTPHYMSPEQVEGRRPDHRSDIYSLGIMLYEMVVGVRPFEGDSAFSIALQHKEEEPPHPREKNPAVPPDLSALILKCLEKRPEGRFSSVHDLLAALDDLSHPDAMPTAAADATAPALADSWATYEPPSFVSEILSGVEIAVHAEPFVGRAEELARMDESLRKAASGDGQVIFVSGSAGSGKTELAAHFVERALQSDPELLVVGGKCNAYTGSESPYFPFRQALDLLTGDIENSWALGRLGSEQALRLWRAVPGSVADLVETGPELMGTLLNSRRLLKRAGAAGLSGAPLAVLREKAGDSDSAATAMEQEIVHQVCRVLFQVAQRSPLIVVLDDLHWVDRGSASLLFHLARQLMGHRLLVVGTYRPENLRLGHDEERHPMEPVVNELAREFGDVVLELGEAAGRGFVDAYLDSQPNCLGEGFRTALSDLTQGHPLFTAELLKALRERGDLALDDDGLWTLTGEVDWPTLPPRIEGVIAERLGRLTRPQRELLRWASVEGEEFTAEVLARVFDGGDAGPDARAIVRTLSRDLDKHHSLVRSQGVRASGGSHLSLYRFRHVLFQRFLYGELDAAELSYRHEDVGLAIEQVYAEERKELAIPLARHFTLAGLDAKAIQYRRLAGDRALRLSAFAESIPQFQTCLETLDRLPESAERDRVELETLLQLATALTATAGYSAREVEQVCDRARKVAEASTPVAENFVLLYRLWVLHFSKGGSEGAPELARQLEVMAARAEDPQRQAIADFARGVSHFWAGAQPAAAELLESACTEYDEENRLQRSLTYALGDPLFTARAYRAWNLVLMGKIEEGWTRQLEVQADAEEWSEPFVLTMSLVFTTAIALCAGLPVPEVAEFAERAHATAREHDFSFWQAPSAVNLGWCQALAGDSAGIDLIHQGLVTHEAVGAELARPAYYLRLAEACLAHRRTDEALAATSSALEMSSKNHDYFYDSEVWRVRAEIARATESQRVEDAFRQALAIAEAQGAGLFRLRAATGLARLLDAQRRHREARELLEPVLDGFTDESFDELAKARELMNDLRRPAGAGHPG